MCVTVSVLGTRELVDGLEMPIKVHCTSAKHDVTAFHLLFTLEKIDGAKYELVGRVALSPINSRKRAGKSANKKDDDDSSQNDEVPAKPEVASVQPKAVNMSSKVPAVVPTKKAPERKRMLNRVDPSLFLPPDQPLLLVREADELPLSVAYVVGVIDRSSGSSRGALQPPTQPYLRQLARNLGSTFESSVCECVIVVLSGTCRS